jgi:hypothetical protein
MRQLYFGTVFVSLSLTLFPLVPAAAQAPDANPDLGANAAMKYWQAFALLPNLDNDQEKILQAWNEISVHNEAALKLIAESRMSRVYLQRGAKLQHCDWSLDYEDGIGLHLAHCPKSLTLARLAGLHARHEFEQGHWKEGWEDVTALRKLGRHVQMGPQFVVRWVGYRIETFAIEAAAPYLPELKPLIPDTASAGLDTLPAGPTLQQMVLSEKQTGLIWLIRELKTAEKHKEGSWKGVWEKTIEEPQSQNRDGVQSAKTFQQAITMLEDLLPFYDQLAAMMVVPWKEFDAQFPEFVKKAKAASPLAADFFGLPIMDQIVARERRYQTQMALFQAAIGVVQSGPDTLKDIKDPFGSGPFEYRALVKGFELKSKLNYQAKPVTLTVGHGKKE